MNLVEHLRSLGLKMSGRYADGRCVGWTTDETKAMATRNAGAVLREYRSADPACSGWEVNCHASDEVQHG